MNQGVLQVGDGATSGVLGAGSNVYTDATLTFNRTDDVVVTNPIGGSGTVINAGTGDHAAHRHEHLYRWSRRVERHGRE